MTLYQLWDPTVQFQTRSGKNLVNGLVKVTYLDRTELAPVYDYDGKAIQNPVTLDENGRAAVYVEVDKQYTIHVYDQNRQLVYTQNIREYPKDVNIVIPTIESTESIAATLDGNTYTLDVKDDYIKKFAGNTRVVTYDVTQWTDIDFTKNLLLRYISHDTVVSTATYTADDTSLKFYAYIDGEVYVVQLLHDTNEWSATVLDTFETYIATYDATTLDELNQLSTDVLVYMKQDDAVYMCSYRSTSEWRFTQIDGDMVNEATLKSTGWTEDSYSLGGNYTAGYGLTLQQGEFDVDTSVIATKADIEGLGSPTVLTYGVVPSQTFNELTELAAKGLLYAKKDSTVLPANAWSNSSINFYYTHGRFTEEYDYYASGSTRWVTAQYDSSKVASQAGQAPDYLGEVIKAGQNITVTKDGAYVTIASTASGGSSMQLSFVASKDSDFVTSFYLVNTNVADKQLSVAVTSLYADGSYTDAFDGYWQYTCELDYCLITVKLPDTFTWRVSGKYDRVADGILVTLHQGQTVVLHQYYDTLTIDTGTDVSTSTSLTNSSNDPVAASFSIIASKFTKKR